MNDNIKISGIGRYLPKQIISSEDIDKRLGKEKGWTEGKYNIQQRHFASNEETTSYMSVKAAKEAINDANIDISLLDCIICAGAVMQQAMPGTAPLIQKKLGLSSSGCAALDINSSCLGFLTALDIANLYIKAGRYKTILIVACDSASISLDWEIPDICANFGDGAVAVVVQSSDNKNGIMATHHVTYGKGYDYCQITAGGTRYHATCLDDDIREHLKFKMNGKKTYKLVSQHMNNVFDELLNIAGMEKTDIDLFIPHQASSGGLQHMSQKLDIPQSKIINIFSLYGNQVSASIPNALYEAVKRGRLERGDTAMLIGTAAGLSIIGIILEY